MKFKQMSDGQKLKRLVALKVIMTPDSKIDEVSDLMSKSDARNYLKTVCEFSEKRLEGFEKHAQE
jgi:hypothetical protein